MIRDEETGEIVLVRDVMGVRQPLLWPELAIRWHLLLKEKRCGRLA